MAFFRYTLGAGDAKLRLTAMGYSGLWNGTDQVPLRAVESGQNRPLRQRRPDHGGKTHRFSLSAEYQQNLGSAVLQAVAYGVKYRLSLFSDFTYFLRDPVNGDQFEQLDDRWQLGTSGTLPGRRALARSSCARGSGGRPGTIGSIRSAFTIRRAAAPAGGAPGRRARDERRPVRGGEASLAPWLRAIAGLRYDHYFFDVTSGNPANSGRADAGRLSPKLSAILGPWAKTELFANFGLGFHSNDARASPPPSIPGRVTPFKGVTPLVPTHGGEIGVRTESCPRCSPRWPSGGLREMRRRQTRRSRWRRDVIRADRRVRFGRGEARVRPGNVEVEEEPADRPPAGVHSSPNAARRVKSPSSRRRR